MSADKKASRLSFVTLGPEDANFQDYLTGRFSRQLRAIPEATFSKDVNHKKVTFRIVESVEITKPSKPIVIFMALRPKYLLLSLGPIVALGLENLHRGTPVALLDFVIGLLSFSCLYFSFFLLNDYLDHVSGQDRNNPRRGSQIIQKGWEPAYRIQQWAFVNLGLGLLLGALVVNLRSPLVWLTVAFLIASFILFAFLRRWGVMGLTELIIFCCFGPVLVLSFQAFVIHAPIQYYQLFLAGFFGAQAVIYFHLRQLENIFDGSQLGIRNLVTSIGFDRSKYLISIEAMLSAVWFVGVLYWAKATWPYYLGVVVVLPTLRNLYDLSSPLASLMKGMSLRWLGAHLVLLILLFSVFGGLL